MKFNKPLSNSNYRAVLLLCLVAFVFQNKIHSAENPVLSHKIKQGFADSIPTKQGFGMRTRKIPQNPENIFEPVIITDGPTNEATIIRISSGLLKIFYINRPGKADKMMSVSSSDNGISWSEPKTEFNLPGEAYYANRVLQDSDGTLHCIFHIYGTGNNGYRGKHLDLWHTKMESGKEWEKPNKIFDGYVGSIRGFLQLKNKRLLIPMSEADQQRAAKPAAGLTDYGLFETICLYSDDMGTNWKKSETHIKIPVESTQVTRYGAVEPNVLELKNGKLWMLIRTNKGHLYESFSNDKGLTWEQAKPSVFISSDSPAEIIRLTNGKILVLWNADQRYDDTKSYANGGREVLHAAISADEGKSWKGSREVFHSEANPVIKGDRGTAYASAIETKKGKIVFVAGQGEGGRSIVCFDPNWLTNKEENEDFSNGLAGWTFYGTDSTAKLKNIGNEKVLYINPSLSGKKTNTSAVWNFPITKKGEISMVLVPEKKANNIHIALTDHFTIAADTAASKNSPIHFVISNELINIAQETIQLNCRWDVALHKAEWYLNKKLVKTIAIQKSPVGGLNYIRIGTENQNDPGLQGFYLKHISSKSFDK